MLTVDLDRLGVHSGDTLLDAGCGGGRHCFGAVERGVRVTGIDLDMESLRLARAGLREHAVARGTRGSILRADVFGLPFRDASFDRVICSEVMEHVHDYPAAVRELVRVLKPHGTIGITIPTATTESVYLRLTRDYFESPGGHIRIFKPRDLARAMSRAGLCVTGVSFAHSLHSLYWVLRSVLGVHREWPVPTRAYRKFLLHASQSRLWCRLEQICNWVWPKSLVLYGIRLAAGRD